uniref:Glucuronosyltransferase n=1 Tax=Meloidogyne hapla TaxID=6305 RepID=A0A1I8AYY9_MELHA
MPLNWINITYHDSKYWEDTLLAERVSATGVVQAYCEKRLDAIFGFADAYSLATVSKISAGFGDGVPVLTTTGLTTIIGSKKSYPYVTRMRGSYTQMAEAAYKFIALQDQHFELQQKRRRKKQQKNSFKNNFPLNYQNLVFMYHDKRRALNKPPPSTNRAKIGETGGYSSAPDESPSSSCYFSSHAIKSYFQENNDFFMEIWKSQTPHVAFDEELTRSKEEVNEWVKLASMQANGLFKIF